ncbi:MAG: STAS domain-containing protein [Pseudonocardiaceae bacterium]
MLDIVVEPAEPGSEPAVLLVDGEVDLATAPQLVQAILDLLAADPPPHSVRVDLSNVPLVDSSGVEALVRGHKRATQLGVSFAVRRPQQIVRQVLRISGLLQQLTEHEPLPGGSGEDRDDAGRDRAG